jgi:TPR repeat protein
MSHQSLTLDDLLDALQFLSSNGSGLAIEDWKAIASGALAGSAPAQYLVAAAFERLDDFSQARYWYARSAAQQYRLALSRLVALKSASAA